MRTLSFVLACLLGIFVSGCASNSVDTSSTDQMDIDFQVPDSTTLLRTSDLRISPFDTVAVRVFGIPDLDGTYEVDENGILKLPLIGRIQAQGYTATELEEKLALSLTADFLQDADVSVTLTEVDRSQITLDGAVAKPGLYPLPGRITLLQALAMGGGLDKNAAPERIAIFRTIEGKRHAAVFNLTEIRQGKADDPIIFGNDIIVVDGRQITTAYRELLRSLPLLGLFLAF